MDAYDEMRAVQAQKDALAQDKMKKRKLTELSRSMAVVRQSSSDNQTNIRGRFRLMEVENVDRAWATAFYANGLPFHLSQDPLFQEAVKITAEQASSAYRPPSAWKLSHTLLDGAVTTMDADLQVHLSALDGFNYVCKVLSFSFLLS